MGISSTGDGVVSALISNRSPDSINSVTVDFLLAATACACRNKAAGSRTVVRFITESICPDIQQTGGTVNPSPNGRPESCSGGHRTSRTKAWPAAVFGGAGAGDRRVNATEAWTEAEAKEI